MNYAIIIDLILAVIQQFGGAAGSTTLVGKVVDALVQIVPVIIKEYKDLLPIVQNIIMVLKSDPSTSSAQLVALEAMEQQWDDEFEVAANKALEEDNKG